MLKTIELANLGVEFMNTKEQLMELGRRASRGEVTSEEFDAMQIHLMSSMYQESKYDRENTKEEFKRIHAKLDTIIKSQEDSHTERQKIKERVAIHSWIIGILVGLVGLVASWAVPRILEQIFR